MPEMHTTVVRFGGGLWKLIEDDAKRRDVSIAEWLRTAAAIRIGYQAAREGSELEGQVIATALEREGQRNGDRLDVADSRQPTESEGMAEHKRPK